MEMEKLAPTTIAIIAAYCGLEELPKISRLSKYIHQSIRKYEIIYIKHLDYVDTHFAFFYGLRNDKKMYIKHTLPFIDKDFNKYGVKQFKFQTRPENYYSN